MDRNLIIDERSIECLSENELIETEGGIVGAILAGCSLAIVCSYYAGKALAYAMK